MEGFLTQSLLVEDICRRIFIVSLDDENLGEILQISNNLSKNLKQNPFICELKKAKMDKNYLDEIRWEFNRLFVGPARPKAVAYESVYFDYHTMFGKKTMEVREFYTKVGLKVAKFDKFPDDFIGYEFEYLYFMSHKALNLDSNDEILKDKYDFLISHPCNWFDKFCELCIKESKFEIWQNFGKFLQIYLKNEVENLKEILNKSSIKD